MVTSLEYFACCRALRRPSRHDRGELELFSPLYPFVSVPFMQFIPDMMNRLNT